MKTYYFPDNTHFDFFFGAESPVCVDAEELQRLADGWGLTLDELRDQVHEATADEISEYGVYNS